MPAAVGAERCGRQGRRDRPDTLPALRQRRCPAGARRWSCSGSVSAFYGVAIGITQANPKTVLAYSSVSQMGVIAAVLGMGLAGRRRRRGARYRLLCGAPRPGQGRLVPGRRRCRRDRRAAPAGRRWLLAAVLALGLGGLPLTGGALAKLAVKAPLGDGVVGLLANRLGGRHDAFSCCISCSAWRGPPGRSQQASASTGLAVPWQAMALASVAVPWLLYPFAGGTVSRCPRPAALFDALWPVLVGAALALALRRWEKSLPLVPAGDIVGAGGERPSAEATPSAPRWSAWTASYGNGPQRACRCWQLPSYSARRPCSALERSPTAGCTQQ